jgi:integrase
MAVIEERKQNDGTTAYRVKVRIKGRPAESQTFEKRSDAKNWATKREYELRNELRFGIPATAKHTVADLIDRYLEHELAKKSATRTISTACLAWWKQQIGHVEVSKLTPVLLAKQRDKLLNTPYEASKYAPSDWSVRRKSPATVVRYMAMLSHALSVAANEWQWIATNPMAKVKRPRLPQGRVRFLSDEERDRLLRACQDSPCEALYPIVIVAISTGARKGEILGLRWKDVDLVRSVAWLEQTKNGERRVLPLTHHAGDLIRRIGDRVDRNPDDFVFPREDGAAPVDIKKHFVRAVKEAGIEDFRFHDLRHCAASYLAMNGATLPEIAAILGHKTLQMVQRYAHLSDQHVTGVVERMNKAIFREPANDNVAPLPRAKRARR